MMPLTAVTFVVAGVALWLVGTGTPDGLDRVIGRVAAGLVVLVGALTLIETLFGLNLGIDQLVFRFAVPSPLTRVLSRPSPQTALTFILIGLALIWLDARSRRLQRTAQALLLISAANALMVLIGYAYGVESLYGVPTLLPYTGMSPVTALTFLALAIGLSCAHPERGLLGVVTGEGFGNMLARRLLPAVIAFPLLLGFLVAVGEREGLYGSPFTLALLTVTSVALLGTLVVITARSLNDKDRERRRAYAAERGLRTQLEALYNATLTISTALAGAPTVDLHTVLQTIVAEAVKMTGAEYGALGIGSDPERPFEPWVFSGISAEQAATIGPFPRPVGALGAVVFGAQSVRLHDLPGDPRFRGFPPRHPPLRTFLGVPVLYNSQSLGNLYLAEKRGGEDFTADDQRAAELLALKVGVLLEEAQQRAAVEVALARLQTILRVAPLPILSVDPGTGRLTANPAASQLLGLPIAKDIDRAAVTRQLAHVDGRPITLEELPSSRALRGEAVRDEELLLRHPSGRQLQIRVSAVPIRGRDKTIHEAVIVAQDVTAQKEEQRVREEWVSVVAHDLRQPVALIIGYASLLAGEAAPCPPPLAAHAREILASARQLNRLIGDLLDFSRIEAGRVTIRPQAVDLPTLVREVVDRQAAATSGHPVRVIVRGMVPYLEADPGRVEQVLTNLVSNAAKYGDPGTEIVVEVAPLDRGGVVAVTNHGPGLPPEELPRVFSRFYRTGCARSGPAEGLGLGLYISKGLVEAHGGRIWVQSVPGETTTFAFTLPTRSALERDVRRAS
jgi:PAS domain S-box-containing protein